MSTVTVKIEDLRGPALDWAVAKAVGDDTIVLHRKRPAHEFPFDPEGPANDFSQKEWKMWRYFQPSTDWAQGGPLIEKYGVQICPPELPVHRHGGPNAGFGESGYWSASIFRKGDHRRRVFFSGEPLVLAMRAIIAFHFGDAVEIPLELVEAQS